MMSCQYSGQKQRPWENGYKEGGGMVTIKRTEGEFICKTGLKRGGLGDNKENGSRGRRKEQTDEIIEPLTEVRDQCQNKRK